MMRRINRSSSFGYHYERMRTVCINMVYWLSPLGIGISLVGVEEESRDRLRGAAEQSPKPNKNEQTPAKTARGRMDNPKMTMNTCIKLETPNDD